MTISQLPFASRYFSAPDGLRLHVRDYGSPLDPGVPVVCLPGLTRNSADFGPLASALASGRAGEKRRVLALDSRGRGLSERDRNWRNYTLEVESGDLLAVLTATGIARAVFVGTSRGGLLTMGLAATRPSVIHAVVLNDIGPVVEPRGMARIRSYVGKLPPPHTATDAIDLLKRLMSRQFTSVGEEDWALYAKLSFADAKGNYGARYDPQLLKPLESLDLEQPLPSFWPQFDGLRNVPLLVLRGANSDILSAETFAEMKRRHPSCESLVIEGQGHPPLLLDAASIDGISQFVAAADPR
ncbi:alpha/beta fold hydrolase [Methylocapsa acidiphila]|uniref:alpha/beta fold hydrolase n=1 Tax=Methylocapsa acidiphila TaxID=133552 RepID=UPI000413EED8|nr:alpha/beta hydrolase [Methylocapsa acidiphila]